MGSRGDDDLLISYLEKIDKRHDRLEDKIDIIIVKQNETHNQLKRNTDSLIKHEHRTYLAEKRLEFIERHVDKINLILDFLKPTKIKIIVALVVIGIVTGGIDISSADSFIKQIISFLK